MIMRDIFFDIMGYTKGDEKKNKKHFNIYNNKININYNIISPSSILVSMAKYV